MIKAKLLAAAAAVALVASGVVANAQDNPNANHEQRPGAERAEPRAPQGGQAPRAADTQRHEQPMRNEASAPNQAPAPKMGEVEHKEAPRAAQTERRDAPGQGDEHRRAAQSGEQNRSGEPHRNEAMRPDAKSQDRSAQEHNAQDHNRMAEPSGQRQNAPAARTGENDRMRNDDRDNAPRTAEHRDGANQPRVIGNVRSSPEHATRVGEVLQRQGHREHVDFGINVGARVPERVAIYPLPDEIIGFAPEYRGYDYFVDDNDEVVFVSPDTHEVVGAIDYEGRAADEDSSVNVSAARPCPIEK